MQKIRIIKRYANRRLYDTEISKYITLDEIQALVLKQVKFKIVDDQTDKDMTHYVLLQIVNSQENGLLPIFTTPVLENIIRFYGNPLQKTMSQFLEKSFLAFTEQQGFQDYLQSNPLEIMNELTKKNMDIWQSTFLSCFKNDTRENPETDNISTPKTSKKPV